MVLLLVEYGVTVETMYPFKFHFPSDGKQILINAGGNVVHLIIRAHDAGHISIDHTIFEWQVVCVLQILLRDEWHQTCNAEPIPIVHVIRAATFNRLGSPPSSTSTSQNLLIIHVPDTCTDSTKSSRCQQSRYECCKSTTRSILISLDCEWPWNGR